MIRSTWRLITSTRFTIFLLIALCLVSVLGTFILQGGAADRMAARAYGQETASLLRALGLFDVYHTPLFQLGMLLLVVNLLACTCRRLPHDLRWLRGWRHLQPEAVENNALRSFTTSLPPPEIRRRTVAFLSRHHYSRQVHTTSDGFMITSAKSSAGRFGYHLVHAGIVLVVLGGWISGHYGIEGFLHLPQGETVTSFEDDQGRLVDLGFGIRHDDFELKWRSDARAVEDYLCTLSVMFGDKVAQTRTIEVNKPLEQGGFSFYQNSYWYEPEDVRFTVTVKSSDLPGGERRFELPLGQPQPIGEPWDTAVVEVVAFIPDAVVGEGGRLVSMSDTPRFPAIEVRLLRPEQPPLQRWAFLAMADMADHYGAGPVISFTDMRFVTGLQVTKDPGGSTVLTGGGILMTGLLLGFLLHPRRLHVVRRGDEVFLSGDGRKNRRVFERERDELEAVLRAEQGDS